MHIKIVTCSTSSYSKETIILTFVLMNPSSLMRIDQMDVIGMAYTLSFIL